MSRPIPVTLIPGDGIGPEIVAATLAALEALEAPFEWDRQIAGLEGVKAAADPLPSVTQQSIHRTRLALKGPLETPSAGDYRSSNVRLREEFKLDANLGSSSRRRSSYTRPNTRAASRWTPSSSMPVQ
jgi:isocitrate dehydrogenase (NAD+)